jgi:anaerobic dimethyl sulfoxide reductase subunit B (iron-sulfur subunit)
MTQYGFFYDQSRCAGCRACSISCKGWYDIPPGPLKYMRVYQWEQGAFPNLRMGIMAVPCYHCENPVCVSACEHQAIFKEDKYGAVLIDQERCQGDRNCWNACPYGAIVFASDDRTEKAHKCTMCVDRLEQGLTPICVLSCSFRAMEFGPIEELREKWGTQNTLEGLPAGEGTQPAVVFKARNGKKELIPYDATRALELWQQRGPFAPEGLPPTFTSAEAVLNPPEGLVGRSKLVLKPNTVADLMAATVDDD